MTFILNKTSKLKSYHNFNINLDKFLDRLKHFRNEIKYIPKTRIYF